MRKFNMILTMGILLLVLIHGIMGAFGLFGANANALKVVARVAATLIAVHVVLTTILTIQTCRARKKAGAGYFKENRLFWTRRITGFTILIPLYMHLMIFMEQSGEAYRLREFTTGRMISQILLVLTLALHILTNVRPALIGFGVKGRKAILADAVFFLSVMLLIFAVAFFIYYLRWIRL